MLIILCKKLYLYSNADADANADVNADAEMPMLKFPNGLLSRITPFMNISKSRILMNSFFNSQFNYCPLVWMFHSRSINNKINHLHERFLRITYNDFKSSFENLLEKDGTASIHVKNLQKLSTEIFKTSKKFCVSPMNELFHQKFNHYDLRNPYEFSIPKVNSVFHGQGSILDLGPLVGQLVPSEFKNYS